jgi:acyl-coenzyme A thioesterase PaaI-like protein
MTTPRNPRRMVPIGTTEVLMGLHRPGAVHVNKPDSDNGHAEAILTIQPSTQGLSGRTSDAISAVVIDHILAAAIRAKTSELGPMATTQMNVDILRPLPEAGTRLDVEGESPLAGPWGGMASGSIRGEDGTEYVRASGWYIEVPGADDATVAGFHRRMAQNEPSGDPGSVAQTLGLDVESFAATAPGAAGEGPGEQAPPRSSSFLATEGPAFTARPDIMNENGVLHGGALTMMAILAAEMSMPDRDNYQLQSFKVDFLRGATGEIRTRLRRPHFGRRFRVITVEAYGEAGVFATVDCGFRITP